jgi:exodeoxyribonuclease V alpha subunit
MRDESIDLTSVRDSGEVRRVSRDYVLVRLQPVYASTVHGTQGERRTPRWRGRRSTERASTSALPAGGAGTWRSRSLAPTRTCSNIGATIMRETAALTIQDAMSEAEAELQRSACARALEASGPSVGPHS